MGSKNKKIEKVLMYEYLQKNNKTVPLPPDILAAFFLQKNVEIVIFDEDSGIEGIRLVGAEGENFDTILTDIFLSLHFFPLPATFSVKNDELPEKIPPKKFDPRNMYRVIPGKWKKEINRIKKLRDMGLSYEGGFAEFQYRCPPLARLTTARSLYEAAMAFLDGD
jgi:hypothetical protein